MSSSTPNPCLGPGALLQGRAGGSDVGDALLILSSLPPVAFAPGTCEKMSAPLETSVRNCTLLPANTSRCCWLCIALVLGGFSQRSFGWCCWFAGSGRCPHLENASCSAAQRVRTAQTCTRVHKPTSAQRFAATTPGCVSHRPLPFSLWLQLAVDLRLTEMFR